MRSQGQFRISQKMDPIKLISCQKFGHARKCPDISLAQNLLERVHRESSRFGTNSNKRNTNRANKPGNIKH